MTPNPTSERDPNQSRQHSRRTALTTIAAAGATSLSGCLGILGDSDSTTTPDDNTGGSDDSTDGTPTATATPGYALPEYTQWAYPKGTRDELSRYLLQQYNPQAILNNEGALLDGVRSSMDGDMVDVTTYLEEAAEPAEVKSLVNLDGNRIHTGPWSAAEMESSIEAFVSVEEAGELGDYQLYENTDLNEGLAVTDGLCITGRFNDSEEPAIESPVEVVKAIINTHAGDAPRYGDASSDFAMLLNDASPGYYNQTIVDSNPDPETDYPYRDLKGKLGSHLTLTLEGDGTRGAFRILFETVEAASEQAVQDFAEQSTGLKNWTDKSVTQQTDRVFTIEGTVPTE